MDGHSEGSAAPTWRPTHSPWLIGISVLLATFMEVLDTSIANVALPHIAGNLSATTEEATWVLTSYLVSNAIILSAAGWLSRYFGRKRYLAFSVILFTVSSALCGMAHSLGFLIVARVLQGLGGGGLQPLAQAVLLESFPPEKRGVSMAAFGMGIVVAPIIGPTLGGWLTDSFSWRWIFLINIPIGLTGLLMQQMYLEDPPYMKKQHGIRVDYIGFGLLALWVGLLQIILDKGQQADWFESAWVARTSILVAVLFVTFIVWELRRNDPIVNLRVLSDRNFAVGTCLVAVLGVVLYGSTVLLPIFLQGLMRYTALLSGLAVTPRGLGSMLSMIVVGRIIHKTDDRFLVLAGFAGIGATCWVLSRLNLDIALMNVGGPLILNGFAMGFIFVPMTTLSMETLRQDRIYQATGLYSLMRNIGGGIGISSLVTYLSRQAQVHQVYLASRLSAYDPLVQDRMRSLAGMAAAGGAAGSQPAATALAMMYRSLLQQAQLLSFMDCFRWLSILCLVSAPLVFLFGKPRRHRGGEMMRAGAPALE